MTRRSALVVLLCATLALPTFGQFGKFKETIGKAANKLSPSKLLEGEPPITTGLADATFADPNMDGYGNSEKDQRKFKSLSSLQRTPDGGFMLKPGHYEMHTQSYCIKAGTYGPGGGDGYLFASPKGAAEDAVVAILRNSVAKPEIPQYKIQTLLWAIIARAKFEELSTEHKLTASQLLTPQQIAMLNRSGLDILPGPVLDRAMASLPPLVRRVLEAEAELRRMLSSANASFAEMERIAVLAGAAPLGEGSKPVPSGRWSKHPDGYYVRYLPSGYSHTVTQIWVPEDSPAIGKEYDPAMHIAVPGNTARQRLIQSGRPHKQS